MNISGITIGMIKGTIVISAVGIAVGVFFVPHVLFYVIGVVLGAAVSVLKIVLLERSINKALSVEDKTHASNIVRIGYMPRYILTASAMLGSWFLMGLSGFIGFFVGTLAMSFSAYIAKFFFKDKDENKGEKAA